MTRKDIDNIISIICPNDEDFEKPIISPKYLKQELEQLALEQEPWEDCISRKAVMDCFKKWQPYMSTRIFDFEEELSALPLVIPQESKIGHWIDVESLDGALWNICSECGESQYFATNYCPNCGAKMIEPPESETK